MLPSAEVTASRPIAAPGRGGHLCPIARHLREPGESGVSQQRLHQYVNLKASNRYTIGRSAVVAYVQGFSALSDDDILATIQSVAATTGQAGYGHIYHVLLPPGQDGCQSPGICFSNS